MPQAPLATYRLQLHAGFGFAACREILPYLKELGVSHLYLSPITTARPGSLHGYDVCDHTKVSTELGGREAFEELSEAARKLGLGLILDIVPNHMAVSGDNQMLVDLLENGPDSRYFETFDIDWEHPLESLRGRLLAPFLGGFFGEALMRGELTVDFDQRGFFVRYFDLVLPLAIASYPLILGLGVADLRRQLGAEHQDYVKLLGILYSLKNLPGRDNLAERYDQIFFIKRLLNEIFDHSKTVRRHLDAALSAVNGEREVPGKAPRELLAELLSRQHFRLAFWKVAADEIDYRRFFTVNDLISLRIENAAVFDQVHGLVLDLLAKGHVQGLRVDHIDGLLDPTAYLKRLREAAPEAYLVVEKILALGEPLPAFWPVQGTTGYDFLNALTGLFVAAENRPAFAALARRQTGFDPSPAGLEELTLAYKQLIIRRHMGGDVDNLAHTLKALASRDVLGSDLTLNALRQAIAEILAAFPVYRTYLSDEAFRPADLTYIKEALDAARQRKPDLAYELDFLERFLLLRAEAPLAEEERRARMDFVKRFQQFTGPLMAKGFEDTVLYLHPLLLALNEVGGRPDCFGLAPEAFLTFLTERAGLWPGAMNATATHDTKRGEDARMRLAALSELPQAWREALKRFKAASRRGRTTLHGEPAPDARDEYLLYQTIVSTWPAGKMTKADTADYGRRLADYLRKAVREAKAHGGWLKPDTDYEEALSGFAARLVHPAKGKTFRTALAELLEPVSRLGMIDSLAQTLLKVACPGVPDVYQGTEFWDLSFVDPDNRRPVDFAVRRAALAEIKAAAAENSEHLWREILARWPDGRVKLFVLARALAARAAAPELFARGESRLLPAAGAKAGHVLCLARSLPGQTALIVIPRLVGEVLGATRFPVGAFWEDTRLALDPAPAGPPREALTGRELPATDTLYLKDVLKDLPLALMIIPQAGEVLS